MTLHRKRNKNLGLAELIELKNLILLLSIIFTFISCSQNEKNINNENSIYGAWELVERFDGGSPNPIQVVENGEILIFGIDNSYSNNSYSCNGNYIFGNSIIEIFIPCITQDLIKFTYSLKNGELILSSYPSTCDEGCYDKYKKVPSEE